MSEDEKTKKILDENNITVADLEKAIDTAQNNHGIAKDLWHPDYGWLIKDGEPTDAAFDYLENELRQNFHHR